MNDVLQKDVVTTQRWIERQPLLNRHGDTIGYEVRRVEIPGVDDNPLDESALILSHVLGDIDDNWLPAGKRLFLRTALPVLLDTDFLALLPEGRVVLDLSGDPADIVHEMLDACDALRRRHISICLDDPRLIEHAPELLVRAEFVKLDLRGCEPYTLYQRYAALKGLPLQRVIRNVANNAQYRFCHDAGFDVFHGSFFMRPEIVEHREPIASLAALVSIFDLVGAQAPAQKIEAAFKRDPALMLKFLGYINSAGMGLMRKVSSITHAIQVLGYQQLYRWVALLLYAAGQGEAPAALMKAVLARSRFIELLGSDLVPRHEQETLFVTGMVSMLDVVFGRPLIEVIGKLPLADSVVRAVLDHEGIAGSLLMLAKALEEGDVRRVESLAQMLGLAPAAIMKMQGEAVGWAESFGAA